MTAARAAAFALAGTCVLAPAAAQDEDSDVEPRAGRAASTLDGSELPAPVPERIRSGLAWLAARQTPDGAIGPAEPYGAASTALAAVAFLAGGHVPGRGPIGLTLGRAVDHLCDRAEMTPSGYLGDAGRMYSHGFATLCLAEVHGMCADPARRARVTSALQRAVNLIEHSQDRNGGWWYEPSADSGEQGADISVTIGQAMALRAAQGAGVSVSAAVVDRALRLVRYAAHADGGFAYRVKDGRRISESNFPRAAAGVCTLFHLGDYTSRELRAGLAYVDRRLTAADADIGTLGERHYSYAIYYATLACFQAGGETWARHFPTLRDHLLTRQSPDGSWQSGDNDREVNTALACIALQVPLRYLPILQR